MKINICPNCKADSSWLVERPDGTVACNKCDSVTDPRSAVSFGEWGEVYGVAYDDYLRKHGSGPHSYENATRAGFEAIAKRAGDVQNDLLAEATEGLKLALGLCRVFQHSETEDEKYDKASAILAKLEAR